METTSLEAAKQAAGYGSAASASTFNPTPPPGECLQETTPGRAQRHAEGVDAVDDSGRGGEAWFHAIMGQTRGEDPQTFVRPARGTSPAAWRKCGIALIVTNMTSVALTERFWATSACCCIVPQLTSTLTLKLEGAGGAGEASAGEAAAFPMSDSQPQKVPQQCCSEKRPSRQRLATCDAQSTMHLVGGWDSCMWIPPTEWLPSRCANAEFFHHPTDAESPALSPWRIYGRVLYLI